MNLQAIFQPFPALLYLIILTAAGRSLRRRFLPPVSELLPADSSLPNSRRAPDLFFTLPADFLLGTIPFTTLNYFLAVMYKQMLPERMDPLFWSNLITLSLALLFIILEFGREKPDFGRLRQMPQVTPKLLFYAGSVLSFLFWAWFLNGYVLRTDNGFLGAGFSVFSDYAPHTALVSSFAKGKNFPAEYPHFAGDGIQYHFFFYFLAGNLEHLGLGLASALNLASELGLLAFCSLFGYLAVHWTGRHAAFLLAPNLVFLRSSLAIWYWLREVPALAAAAGKSVLDYILSNEIFIGRQPRDDWGLWNMNVYANQRHLLFVLAAGLLIVVIFRPLLPASSSGWISTWTSRAGWLPAGWKPYIPAFVLLACLPYWHGSVTISVLLILGVMAVFSRGKAAFALAAAITLGMAFFYAAIFSGKSGGAVSVSFYWGFIAEDKSFGGILLYLWELLGLSLPAIFVLPWLQTSFPKKVIAAACILPLVFAFTISLTPDVTVNHKYIMFSQIFAVIWGTDFILRLWHLPGLLQDGRKKERRISPALSMLHLSPPLLAVLLTIVLTATGVADFIAYRNKNKHVFYIPQTSEFIAWLEEATDTDTIFLTAPWHFHPFYLSGRRSWYGHSYYAWSAGHDTAARYEEVKWVFQGGNGPESVRRYCEDNGIRYVIITDDLRISPDYVLNEAFFQQNFEPAANFPAQDNAVIYRIY